MARFLRHNCDNKPCFSSLYRREQLVEKGSRTTMLLASLNLGLASFHQTGKLWQGEENNKNRLCSKTCGIEKETRYSTHAQLFFSYSKKFSRKKHQHVVLEYKRGSSTITVLSTAVHIYRYVMRRKKLPGKKKGRGCLQTKCRGNPCHAVFGKANSTVRGRFELRTIWVKKQEQTKFFDLRRGITEDFQN